MPKPETEISRQQQLIDATLKSIESYGFQGTTIVTISKLAGMSSGIISHYFGGKQGLIQASVRYLLDQLKQGLLEQLRERNFDNVSAHERLHMIVETNFTCFQKSSSVTSTWLCFWAQAVHDPSLARLQRINSKRLQSNLMYSFNQIIPDRQQALNASRMGAALIDGLWLRSTLGHAGAEEFRAAETLCKNFIDIQIKEYGASTCC